jgi:hypothetical protein
MTRALLLAVVLLFSTTILAADPPKKLTGDAVWKEWHPKQIKGVKDYNATGGSPKEAPDVAGLTFTLKGTMTLEDVWNFYAEKCGLEERYKEKHVWMVTKTTPKGECVLSVRLTSLDETAKHRETMFLLKTDAYTVAVTLHVDPDGKTIVGSIAAVVK